MPPATASTAEEFTIEEDSDADCTLTEDDMTDNDCAGDTPDADPAITFFTSGGKPIAVTRLTTTPTRSVAKPIASDYFPVKDSNGNVYRAYVQEDGRNAVVIDTIETDAAVVSGLSAQIHFTTQLARASLAYNANLLKGVTNSPQASKLWKTVFGPGMLLSTLHADSVIATRTEETKKRRRDKTREKRKAGGQCTESPALKVKRANGAGTATNSVEIKQTPAPTVSAARANQPVAQLTLTLSAADVCTVAQFVASL